MNVSRAYWAQAPEALMAELGASSGGLSSQEATSRLARFGPNALEPRARDTAFGLFLGQFKNAIVLILLVATAVSAVTGDWVDALIILGIVFGSATLSYFQERRANDAARELRSRVQKIGRAHV